MSESCPVCDPPESCKCYPYILAKFIANPVRYRKVHDSINGFVSSPVFDVSVDDAARAAALIAQEYGNAPVPTVPIGRKCCG